MGSASDSPCHLLAAERGRYLNVIAILTKECDMLKREIMRLKIVCAACPVTHSEVGEVEVAVVPGPAVLRLERIIDRMEKMVGP